jgi:PAS domain S-box-containing protein
MTRKTQVAARYALAAGTAVAALYLRKLLNPLLGAQNPYHTLWLAMAFSAWYCGVGPSILALIIAVLGVGYWFLPPYGSFVIKNQPDLFGLLGFVIFSTVLIALGRSTRRVMEQRERAEEGLRKAQQELEDRVRERTISLEQKTAEVIEKAALLDLASDAIFVKSADGKISYWNQGAERLYGWSASEAVGHSPHELLRTVFPVPLNEIAARDSWQGELRHIKRDGNQIVVESRWTTVRDSEGTVVGWLEINTDISARKRAEQAARRLSGRILTLQDEERRRIARELHDSLGQYLAALKMNLDLLNPPDAVQALRTVECSEIVDRCLTETRTISHLLHPPLLEEAGLGSAARWYVDGFAQRSGIKVNLDLGPDYGRLDEDAEIALFRTMQEALTNVHRHAAASTVEICLRVADQEIRLEIKDDGRGIPQERLNRLREGDTAAGVGIAGIRERVRELEGALDIQSDQQGTKLSVTIPRAERKSNNPASEESKSRSSVA